MKKTRSASTADSMADDLRPEYDLRSMRGRPNRFAKDFASGTIKVVTLDSDVAKVFRTSDDVNKMLRSVIAALPQAKRVRSTSKRPRNTTPRRSRTTVA